MLSESQNNVSGRKGYKLYFFVPNTLEGMVGKACSEKRIHKHTHTHAKAWSMYHGQFKLFQLPCNDQSIIYGDIFFLSHTHCWRVGLGV